MQSIHILDPEVRDKIAAGEVIIRPVSVIKELVENALDAAASRIDISIKDGGKQLCLVNDDGAGIAHDDVGLAIERYGTSKIKDIEDIDRIRTYGFRGEALASIAQVSHFELETSDGTEGTVIKVVGGRVEGISESKRGQGTRVRVTHLFFNLPVRFKFLRSAQWERRLIVECVKRYAYIHHDVYFTVEENGRSMAHFPAVESIVERLKTSVSSSVADALQPLEVDTGRVRLIGFFSRPDVQERHGLGYLYVNHRPVRYPRFYRLILETYGNPKHPPAFLLNMVVDPDFVDVNIHPTKQEVKFKDERYVADVLTQAVRHHIRVPVAVVAREPREGEKKTTDSYGSGTFVQDSFISTAPGYREKPLAVREPDEFWQLHNTYILSQTRSGLIIVDQHVAHERIIFESIMKGRSGAQRLLFPITLELSPEEYRVYKKTKGLLNELGMEFKEFSARTVVIDGLPSDVHVDRDRIEGLFTEIDGLGNLIKDKAELAKVVACRSAIKAGQKLSILEMQELIDQLFACENPYICPHGRPIVIRFTLEELASKFGRE